MPVKEELGLQPGCYLINDLGKLTEEAIRVNRAEYCRALEPVAGERLARELPGYPLGYSMAQVGRGLIARIDEMGELVIERKGQFHEKPKRDRYASYSQ